MTLTAASPDICLPRTHAAKRVSILEAATYVFCREGFAGANIDMIAAEAGVSRQTIYNHHGDKEKLFVAVVQALTERANAGIFATLATFPDHPSDIEADLVDFAVRLNRNCLCNSDGQHLRKLIEAEGRALPRTLRDLARGRPEQDVDRTRRALRPPRPRRPSRNRRSRCRRASVPGADRRRPENFDAARRPARRRACPPGRDQRGANLPARLRQALTPIEQPASFKRCDCKFPFRQLSNTGANGAYL